MTKCYFSIDFEDFTHDLQRRLGVREPRRTPEALELAYRRIQAFATEHLDVPRLTFFTTGQVARDNPDLVRRIAADGHEVACHYYEHDAIFTQDRQTFRDNLAKAVDVLSQASGQPVRGFRAPSFSITPAVPWAYEELARVFVYDSSVVADKRGDPGRETDLFEFDEDRLHELPLYRRPFVRGANVKVIGGTYLRLLPIGLALRYLHEGVANGFIPIVYLHPYEFLTDREHWVGMRELGHLPLRQRLYWSLRQHQWHTLGNRGLGAKLRAIAARFRHAGPMISQFEKSEPLSLEGEVLG